MSYKVLPQMHRLVEQACAVHGLQIAGVVVDDEQVFIGSGDCPFEERPHDPYYIVELKPNPWGWDYLSCRPHKNKNIDFSASVNNVTVVALGNPRSPLQSIKDMLGIVSPSELTNGKKFTDREVLPSWRGKLIPADELDKYQYYIKRGFMLTEAGPDYIEQHLILGYERRPD